jgi:uncharacterized membrane protein YbhN (UPF0104 family)
MPPVDSPRRRLLLRLAGWAASLGLLGLAALALEGRWEAVGDAGGLPGPGALLLAGTAFLVANVVLALTWREVVRAAGGQIAPSAAAWVWAASQLTRYSLGAMQVGGRAVLGRRYGLTLTAGGVTALVEIGWQTSITAMLVLVTAPWWLGAAEGLAWLAWAGLAPAAVLLAGLLAPERLLALLAAVLRWGPLARLTRGRLGGKVERIGLGRREAARLTALYALNTSLRLGGFLALFAALGGDLPSQAPLAVGAASLGQLVGRLAVFAPGGLGPREGATALAIAPAIGGAPALVLVAATRLVELVAELAFLGLAFLARPAREEIAA